MRISDLPNLERPRERLTQHGCDSLSLTELLAILLRTGNASRQQSALALAQTLLQHLNSIHSNPLIALQSIQPHQIEELPGFGPAKSCSIIAGLEIGKRVYQSPALINQEIKTAEQAAAILAPIVRWQPQEIAAVLIVNAKSMPLGTATINIGAVSETIICFKTLFIPF